MPRHSHIELGTQIKAAQAGNLDAMADLLGTYRAYLMLLARLQIERAIQSRVSASDVVQDTFLQAKQAFAEFRGTTEAELTAWLRKILASKLAMLGRHHRAQRRDVRLEQQIAGRLDQSSMALANSIPSNESSPSQIAQKREQSVLLAEALSQLPEDYQEIIVSRHLQSETFPDIARKMGKSVPSVKSTSARAITKMRAVLVERSS